ncbi:FAD-dependent monooxygenase [Nostoc sp. KVJ3]|uniref:FAD-dependent oxidoreductase n=1 Tax=Nostoc sp. KVJ3 TaxID=457945 RepID=UPI002237CE39|nr:NAD(P)/FAD-dependent oxidoreductase [Nostoc sp. KVJ3]MCW5317758.1 FAD-dependent monooxygenase [Nostoc sp. KVJ3]
MPETNTHTDTSTKADTLATSVISTSTSQEIYDVVVVGAGPIGLATAIGLRKRGIENILVIDQTRTFRQIGQALDLLPNGLQALKYLDSNAYEEVKKTGLGLLNPKQSNDQKTIESTQEKQPPKTSPQWIYKNLQGQIIQSTSLSFDDWFKDYGEGRVSMPWYNLQTTLRQLLPEDRVKANHRCINVANEPQKGCIRIDCVANTQIEANPYAYWINGQINNHPQPQKLDIFPQELVTKSIRAKLLVAADGINSTVRRLLYTDTQYHDFARPEYSGFAAIFCSEITEVTKELWTKLKEDFFLDSPLVTITNDEINGNFVCIKNIRIILYYRPTGELGYIIHLALPLESLQEKSESSLIDLALQELEKAGFPNTLKQLVRLSPPTKMQQRPYYIHRAISDSLQVSNPTDLNIETDSAKTPSPWSAGRIVLVGDAAHGMPPFMGQGANQGLEDALVVTTLIAKIAEENHWNDLQAIAKAFEKYECLRRPLMAYVQEATLKRSPHSSDKNCQEYNQQLYCRNFAQMIEEM